MTHYLKKIFYPKTDKNSAFLIEIGGYWKAYGGLRAILTSRWLWASVILTLFLYPKWLFEDWTAISLSVLPALLGFSIGAMAIIFTFPSTALFKFITWESEEDKEGKKNYSYYIEQAARFVHFVLVQIVAILFSIFASTHYFSNESGHWAIYLHYLHPIKNMLGFLTFMYALTTGAATVFSLFGMARLYNLQASQENKSMSE